MAAKTVCQFTTSGPGLAERTIMVNGVSKAYAMTGWRSAGPFTGNVATAMADLQSQETSNPCALASTRPWRR